jgi:hypothetical protein
MYASGFYGPQLSAGVFAFGLPEPGACFSVAWCLSGSEIIIERKAISRTPREHFMRTAEDELAKFVRKELAFQRAERDERAKELRLPVSRSYRRSDPVQTRKT